MQPNILIIAMAAFLAGGVFTFAIISALGVGAPELSFVVGAVLGTQVAALLHRAPSADNGIRVKLTVGVTLAIGAVILGGVLYLAFNPFAYIETSVPIGVVGSFVLPLVLFGTMRNALSRQPAD